MAINDFIANLVRDLQPVQPLPLPRVRFARWGVAVLSTLAIVAVVIGPRVDLLSIGSTLPFQAHAILLILVAATSAIAALTLAVPGEPLAQWRRIAPVAAVAAWAMSLSGDLLVVAANGQAFWPVVSGVGCIAKAVAFGVAPAVVLAIMLRRGAPDDTRSTLVFASLATTAVGALGVEVTCPMTDPTHLLLWHAAPVIAAALTAVVFGRALFDRLAPALSQVRR